MSLETRKHLLVLLSVLIVAPTSVAVLLWAGLYLLVGLHLRELPFPLLSLAFVVAAAALTAYWVLLLDLCHARRDPLPDRPAIWHVMLGLGVVLACVPFFLGLLVVIGACEPAAADTKVSSHLLLTGPPVLLPLAWLLRLRTEHARHFPSAARPPTTPGA
ncbi:MAG: hypothetical protein KF823_04265 [Xanthomonadales bacterium]|nr:hypothetical protein [Xanthomonadales bacterium]